MLSFIHFLSQVGIFQAYVFKSSSRFNNKTSRPSKKNKIKKPNFKVNLSSSTDIQVEVDRILDKINDQGFGALSEKEKHTLEKAKGLLKN